MPSISWRRLASSSPVAVALLVAVNAIPLAGVLFLGWDLMTVVRIYWLENGVIGVYAALRILTAEGGALPVAPGAGVVARLPDLLVRAVSIGFFTIHYGLFWLAHGLFVWLAFPLLFAPGGPVPADPVLVIPDLGPLALVGVALLASHGASFLFNWLGRKEYRTATVAGEMGAPYERVGILHLTIIFGAMAVGFFGAPVWALVVLVVLKTATDLAAHLRDRERATRRVSDAVPAAAGADAAAG
jgi:hypothetical protein